MLRGLPVALSITALLASFAGAAEPADRTADGPALPRGLTEAERAYIAENPIVAQDLRAIPEGTIRCVAEYDRMEGIMFAYEGGSSWTNIINQMVRDITTIGNAKAYVYVDSTSERNSATSSISSFGADMSKVEFIVKSTDSIWMRDYGPRYIYKGVHADGTGGVRAIVDHTYNRPRPNDNNVPADFANRQNQDRHLIPLVHGGGNFHLESGTTSPLGYGHATRLINNENPGLSESQIIQHWRDYQNLETTLYTPYPTSVDSTQHIDMWMIMIDDNTVMISEWVNEPTASWAITSNNAAASFVSRGFNVIRVPAVRSGGTHYTFTNAVICNDLVLIPTYTNGTASQFNDDALAAWQAACPDKTISQINCQALVTAAGVMHCIVMHVPENFNGESPTVYTTSYNTPTTVDPGDLELLTWMVDDDIGATTVDILLSTDGGASFPTTIASGLSASTGGYAWSVPDIGTNDGRIRIIASDADSNTGFDDNDAVLTITGTSPCPADFTGDGSLDIFDVFAFLDAFNANDPIADFTGDGAYDIFDVFAFLDQFNAGCP